MMLSPGPLEANIAVRAEREVGQQRSRSPLSAAPTGPSTPPGLLEAGEIEYRKVGGHRRVKASSLLDYMRHDDRRRRRAADELSALTQDMGMS